METWASAQRRQPAGAIRQVLVWPRSAPVMVPKCGFAVPLVPGQVR